MLKMYAERAEHARPLQAEDLRLFCAWLQNAAGPRKPRVALRYKVYIGE